MKIWLKSSAPTSKQGGACSSASAEAEAARSAPEPTVMLATDANMPVPPMYRGSTKKEKCEFMDSYMVYKRRVEALNQGTQTRVFIMPLGACIEQGLLFGCVGLSCSRTQVMLLWIAGTSIL